LPLQPHRLRYIGGVIPSRPTTTTAACHVPSLALFAATQPLGFAVPMLVSTVGAVLVFVVTLLLSPETKGKALVSQLSLAA
jgi:hypothetical protein